MLTIHLLLFTFLLYCTQCHAQSATSTRFQPCASPAHTSSPAIVTTTPKVEIRAVNSVCGFWSTWASSWTTHTIACSSGVPCVFGSVGNQVYGYCSQGNAQPVTAAYDYGEGPVAGCGPAQLCCKSNLPAFGTYVFNGGASSFLDCDTSRFWMTATATIAGLPTSTSPSTSTDSTSTASPTNTNAASGSSKLTTTNIITIVGSIVGGVSAIIGAIVGILKYRKKRRSQGGGEFGALVNNTGPDHGQNHYHLHFNDRVNVNFHNSELYLTGGQGGVGSNTMIAGLRGTPRITSANGSSSRLLTNGYI